MRITVSWTRSGCLAAAVLACVVCRAPLADARQPRDVDVLLRQVAERIAEFYRRAQTVLCTEKSVVQPIGWNLSPQGFPRTVESELHVEMDASNLDAPAEATVIRQVRKVNGRAPRERDKRDRSGCTDPNPLSTEPLAFLLDRHRSEYRFTHAGLGKDRNRSAVLIDFKSVTRGGRLELKEDEGGHEDCFDWTGDIAVKGRVWVDADNYDVLRVDRQIGGPTEIRVPVKIQRRYNLTTWMTIERDDLSIRYKTVGFRDPDEILLVPESIDTLTVVRGGLESTRRNQTYSDYRRFLTGGRLIKDN